MQKDYIVQEDDTHLQKFNELKRVLLLQKDRLQLCNLDTEYIDRAIKIAGELEDWSMDIVDIPLVDILNSDQINRCF